MKARVGVDLGGTKIEAVALAAGGEELVRRRVPTPQGDYDGIIAEVCRLVAEISAEVDAQETVGIGTPGSVSPFDGLLKNSNSVVLNGRPFDRDIQAALDRPLVLRNDADCFALSESVDGAGAGAEVVFGVILGTGVGGGLVVDGNARTGPNHTAGEWGHNPLPWPLPEEEPGPACYCGKHGCIETWLSGPGFSTEFRAATDLSLEAPAIVEAAREGDGESRAALDRYIGRLARGLATVINVLDPDVVVLGGGMSNVDELYAEVPAALSDYVFGGEAATRVVKNVHGDSSGVRGAAMLVPE